VTKYVDVPATRHAPADVDEVECGAAVCYLWAARIFADALWSAKADEYFQRRADVRYAEEFSE
jgi:hypothetical protein